MLLVCDFTVRAAAG